jgi:hypothetical protein
VIDVAKNSFTVDTDTCIFPDRLMVLGLKHKYYQAKGLGDIYRADYDTQRSLEQRSYQGVKRVVDVYGLWRVDSSTAWRLTLSNLDPRNYTTGSVYSGNGVDENSRTRSQSWTNVQILMEKKL